MKRLWLGVGVLALALAGCASGQAIQRAQGSLGEAKAAGAEAKAPYEYTAADMYLSLAVEEHGEQDWKAAQAWAEESEKLSGQALQKAKGGAK